MMSLRGVLRRGNLLRRTKKVNFARGSVLAFLCVLRELSEKKKMEQMLDSQTICFRFIRLEFTNTRFFCNEYAIVET